MSDGWVKLYRSFQSWEWYDDQNVKAVFIELLLRATYEDRRYRGAELPAGACVIGLQELSDRLGLSVRQTRTALDKLIKTGEIKKQATNKGTVVTVENWGKYQADAPRATNERQTNDKQTTNKRQTKKA